MARLTKHGYELARVTLHEGTRDGDDYFTEHRTVYSFRSDGHIMRQHHARDKYGKAIGWGWKLWRRVRDGSTTYKRDFVMAGKIAEWLKSDRDYRLHPGTHAGIIIELKRKGIAL